NIHVLAQNNSSIFAGTSTGVYRSTDKGDNWDKVDMGDTNNYVNSIVITWQNIYAGTDGGVFRSTNNGTNWTEINTGLKDKNTTALAISGSTLFAGNLSSGVWKLDVNTLDMSDNNNSQTSNNLLVCYPNPAYKTLTIDRKSLQFPENKLVHYT